jgi:uncharacterized membrane protein YjfL (UPF0719 family)
MEALMLAFNNVMTSIPMFVVAFLVLLVGKQVYNKTTSYDIDDELTEKDNPAFGVAYMGYMIGIAIAITGAFFGTGVDLKEDFITLGYNGAIVILLMRLSVWVNDKFILNKFSVCKEISEDRNVGTGFVVAGSCIATGLMLAGVLSGESTSIITAIRDIGIYFVIGQALLVFGGKLFTVGNRYDVHKVIEDDDNIPAGMSFAGFLIAIGIIAKVTLTGASSDIQSEAILTIATACITMPILVFSSVIADKLFLPKSPLAKEIVVDKNNAVGYVSIAVSVCVALMISAAIQL